MVNVVDKDRNLKSYLDKDVLIVDQQRGGWFDFGIE